MNCPCHSGQILDRCCGRFISHRDLAGNALELMRSRYTAFALGETDYLHETWHPEFCPVELDPDDALRWIGLEIIDSDLRAELATVEFEARLITAGRVSVMRERSNFVFEQGRWLYTNGEHLLPSVKPWKPARNETCPCGSGAKFKRCCGAGTPSKPSLREA